jgi:hypothetical protein
MIQHQTPSRYYSRDGLLKFLKEKFGDHFYFNIDSAGDGYFTFEAPQRLTAVSYTSKATAQGQSNFYRMIGGISTRKSC